MPKPPLYNSPEERPHPPEYYRGDAESVLAVIQDTHSLLDRVRKADAQMEWSWDAQTVYDYAFALQGQIAQRGSDLANYWLSFATLEERREVARQAAQLYIHAKAIKSDAL